MSKNLGYRPDLDGLRCLAVAAVMALHAPLTLAMGGFVGVDVFFVLSGFLITTLLLQDHAGGRSSLRRFYIFRVARLGPALALVCLAVGTGYFAFHLGSANGTRNTLIGAVAAPTYSAAWILSFSQQSLGALSHTWSLSVEEYFYLLWPVLLGWIWNPDSRKVTRRVSVILGIALLYHLAGIVFGISARHIYYGPDFRSEQLLLGCLLAAAFTAGIGVTRRRCDRVLFCAAALCIVALVVGDPSHLGRTAGFYEGGGSTLAAIATVVIIRHLLIRPDGRAARALALSPLVWVGQRSYGLYLWHYPIFIVFASLGLGLVIVIPAEVATAVIVAAVSFRWIETPLRSRIRAMAPSAV